MSTLRISTALVLAGAAPLPMACGDPGHGPTAPADAVDRPVATDVVTQQLEPFTFRAPLEPYRIQQLPDFMIHSRAASDIVMQRSVFPPGPGGWHIHAGPSFVYVIEGQIRLQQYSEKDGCVLTPVFTPGEAYFEVGNEIHRALVVSTESAVLLVVRLNIPVGGPITIPVANPGC